MSTSFRYIETIKKIRYKLENKKYQVIMVTSCLENEGKTSVIANIALALKENHKKVLLIDGDLRKPAIHKIFGLESNDGMIKVIRGKEDVIMHTNEGIDCILGDSSFENASEIIESNYFKAFIEKAREKYDYILIDSAPSAILSDSTSLASMCDGYILVVRQNFIVGKLMEDTVDKLALSHQPIIGAILNQKLESPLRFSKRRGHYYNDRYGYGYQRAQKAGENRE